MVLLPTPKLAIPPHLLKAVVEVKASGQPHVSQLWLGVSKGILNAEYLCSNKASLLRQSNLMEIIRLLIKMRKNLTTFSVGDITTFKMAVSVCLQS